MPMLSLVISPVQAAAIVLPILIVQDVVGVWAFRHSWDGHVLGWMIPGAVLGIGLGYLFAASVSVVAITAAVGLVSLVYGGWQLFRTWLGHLPVERRLPGWVGSAARAWRRGLPARSRMPGSRRSSSGCCRCGCSATC